MIEQDVGYELIRGDALIDELDKLAGIGTSLTRLTRRAPQAKKGLSAISKGRLAGTVVGAGLGAAGGAATSPEDQTGGALRGALLGGVAGLGAGQLATRGGRQQVKHLGQRQLHGLTGYMPRTTAQKARGVRWTGKGMSADERVQALKGIGAQVGTKVSPRNRAKAVEKAMEDQTLTRFLPTSVRKRLASSEVKGLEAQRHAAETGLTSLPGVAKGLVTNPLKTLKTGFVSQGPVGMALGAVPAAMAIPGAVKGESQEYGGPGGLGRFVGENVGYTALGAVPFAPMMAGATLAGKAGELIHKKVSRKPGAVVPPPQGQYYYD